MISFDGATPRVEHPDPKPRIKKRSLQPQPMYVITAQVVYLHLSEIDCVWWRYYRPDFGLQLCDASAYYL